MAEPVTSAPGLGTPGLLWPGVVGAFTLPAAPLPFPQGPLGVQADIYLGHWDDFTSLVYQRESIDISRGRQSQSAGVSTAQCTMMVNNRDFRFTSRNPLGAWYGQIAQNSPVRLSVPNSLAGGGTYLRMEDDNASYATCADSASLQITGTLDVRIDLQPSGYSNGNLIGKWGPVGLSWFFLIDTNGALRFLWNDGSATHAVDSSVPLPNLGRVAARVVFSPSGQTVTFYTAPTMAGTFTQLGNVIATGATSLNAAAGQQIAVGFVGAGLFTTAQAAGVNGQVYEAQILSGVSLVADPVFTAQAAGTTSFKDAQGNTWSMAGTAELSNRLYRFHGELASVSKETDNSLTDIYARAAVSGPLRRRQAQRAPANSAMYRAYLRVPSSVQLAAYWPLEDGTLSTQVASALTGGTAMTWSGTPKLASNSDFQCSAPLPILNGATFIGAVPNTVTWTANVVRFLMEVPSGGDTNNTIVCRAYTTGTTGRMDLIYTTGGGLTLTGYNTSGTQLWTTGPVAFGVNGQLLRVSVELNPTTAGIVTVVPGHNGLSFSTSFSGTIGQVSRVELNAGGGFIQTVVGHLSVQGFEDSVFGLSQPLNAWLGEPAGTRFARICSEEGIRCRIVGFPAVSSAMGYQAQQTITTLLQECETTDQGMIFEPRTCLGVGYLTRAGLYNLQVAAMASFPGGRLAMPFGTVADDLMIINDVTITNTGGSSARKIVTSGRLSVQDPPNGVGRIDTSVSVNAANDGDLANMAGWLLWVRSVDDDRYPLLQFDMARAGTPASIPVLDCGSYLQVTGGPAWVPPGTVRQIAAGFAEKLGPFGIWNIGVNGIPEAPYEVAVTGVAHADTDGSTLATGITAVQTAMTVNTNGGMPPWTTSGGDFPFDVLMDGERITVTSITPSASQQIFTVTRSVNGVVRAHLAGVSLALFQTPVAAL